MKTEEIKDEGKDIKIGPNVLCKDHEFHYRTGTEVKCKKCPLGYLVGYGTEIKDGKLYMDGSLIETR